MQEFRVFNVAYDSGHMSLNVGVFFGTSPKKNIEKALRLIRQSCRESDRLQLLDDLRFEYKVRQEILSELREMEYKRRTLLADFYLNGVSSDLRGPERALKKQKDSIKAWTELLEKERWD